MSGFYELLKRLLFSGPPPPPSSVHKSDLPSFKPPPPSASYPPPSSLSQSCHSTVESPPYLFSASSSKKTPSNSESFQSSGPSSSSSSHKSDMPSFKPPPSASYPPPSSSSQSCHSTAKSPPYLLSASSSKKTPSNSESFQFSGPSSSSPHKSDMPSFKPPPSASYPPPSSSSQSYHSTAEPPPYLFSASSSKKTPSNSESFQSSGPSSSSVHKSDLLSFKPILASSPSISRTRQGRTNYTMVERGASPIFVIPKDIEEMIKKDIVPKVLNRPLSPSTYTDYFASLLYAEDYYTEKWSNYLLKNVTLELQEASINRRGNSVIENESDNKTFVAFEMDSVPERRPFLLSRDFVFLQPTGSTTDSFRGVIYRVVKSKTVLVEFDEDFYAKHHRSFQYNISFSFNRFCLKRAHQAIKAASDPLFRSVVAFPDFVHRSLSSPSSCSFTNTLDFKQKNAVKRILGLSGTPPFLVEGPLSVHRGKLSETGLVIREAIVHIFCTTPNPRILVCAPTNSTCDVLMKNLRNGVSASDMFRANAAFRELDGVPVELLPSCQYRDECFTCPSLDKLKKFKVVLSTFVSSFRLHGEGITAGHFTHIFLVDGSSVTEPELMVALANFANEDTSVVVTGEPQTRSSWVRSKIARQNGLRISYFERLRERKPYKDLDPMFIVQLENTFASDNS